MNNFLEKKNHKTSQVHWNSNYLNIQEKRKFLISGTAWERDVIFLLKLKKLRVGETSQILLYKPINNNIVTNNNRKSLWLSQKEKGDLSDYGMFQFLSALPPRVKGFFFVKFSFKKATKFRSLRHFIQWCQQTIKLPDLIYQNALTKN